MSVLKCWLEAEGHSFSLQYELQSLLSHNVELYIQQILIIAILIVDLNFCSLCICIIVCAAVG